MRVLCIFLAGCFQSIAPDVPDASPFDPTTGKFATTRGADGSYTTVVDSSSMADWTFGDFETGGELVASEPWDLRFQRFHISTNGGVSGTGDVEIAPIPDLAFVDAAVAPATGWISDAPDDDDEDAEPEYALDDWYDYDPMTHVLTPKPLVWAVRTNGGSTIKLEITRYYDEAGNAGWFTLHWSSL